MLNTKHNHLLSKFSRLGVLEEFEISEVASVPQKESEAAEEVVPRKRFCRTVCIAVFSGGEASTLPLFKLALNE
jgi:hypothetical protein